MIVYQSYQPTKQTETCLQNTWQNQGVRNNVEFTCIVYSYLFILPGALTSLTDTFSGLTVTEYTLPWVYINIIYKTDYINYKPAVVWPRIAFGGPGLCPFPSSLPFFAPLSSPFLPRAFSALSLSKFSLVWRSAVSSPVGSGRIPCKSIMGHILTLLQPRLIIFIIFLRIHWPYFTQIGAKIWN